MRRKIGMYAIYVCGVLCLWGWWSCSQGVPLSVPNCKTDQDCASIQRCVGQLCISQQILSQPTEISGLEPDDRIDGAKEETPDTPEASQEPIDSVEEVGEDAAADASQPEEMQGGEESVVPEEAPEAPEEKPETTDPELPRPESPTEPVIEAECAVDQVRVCYDGPTGTDSKGECKRGTQRCLQGKWGPCEGQIVPQPEICGDAKDNNCDGVPDENCPCDYLNKSVGVCKGSTTNAQGICQKPATYNPTEICGDGLDNNCDGTKDESCECNPKTERECGSDTGECQKGKQTCSDQGKWGNCVGEVPPTQEICDGKDNNCNGVIDEGCPCNFLDKSEGVCKTATRDPKGNCTQPFDYQSTEDCNDQKDNNCNGVVNEGCPCLYLGKAQGVCQNLRIGSDGLCPKPNDYSESEICGDGKDNNCNGVIDENCPCNYLNKAFGVCAKATRDAQGSCQTPALYSATTDLCNDNEDNNCDGQVNEGCTCTAGQTQSCGTDKGECKQGTQTCNDQGQWGSCVGEVTPTTEICDGKDNNCDGAIDEGCPCFYEGKQKGVCANAKRNASGVCERPKDYNPTEICGDGIDNDCDGVIDQGCPCHYLGLSVGVCKDAVIDSNGVCGKPSDYDVKEKCGDGKDNDCNGVMEEGCPCNYLGIAKGVCATATRDKQGNCEQPKGYNPVEQCGDNLDNDCDGTKDTISGEICYAVGQCLVIDSSGQGKTDTHTVCVTGSYQCVGTTKTCVALGTSLTECSKMTNLVTCSTNQPCPADCPKVAAKNVICVRNSFCSYP